MSDAPVLGGAGETNPDYVVRARELCRTFDDHVAVDGVTLDVPR